MRIRSLFISVLIFSFASIIISCAGSEEKVSEVYYTKLRNQMVDNQIIARGIKDEKVIKAMRKVSRHFFIPEEDRKYAYNDSPVPIGFWQTISQPYIVALMTESLRLKGEEKVLEIGTGSGYQAAILAEIAKEIYTIEIIEPLALSAKKRLKDMGYKNIEVRTGDGYQGWKEHSLYDCIIVTAAPPNVPQPLIDQLKVGGRMVVPVGKGFQYLVLIEKSDKGIREKKITGVSFVPMTGEAQQ